jgi:ubiquitin C-terminal hydrolase
MYIQLCRFQNNLTKNNLFVEIPDNLNLIPYCNETIQKEYKKLNYKLIGKINHYGSVNGGHYTADCYDLNKNKWYNFNDETITMQNYDTGNEYIIMYYLME